MKNTAVSKHQARNRCAGSNCGHISVELKRHNPHWPLAIVVAYSGMTKHYVPLCGGAHDALPEFR